MRKGILSLSPFIRGKASAKKKTGNMELAEQAAARKAEAAKEQKAETKEKAFVQTITVPKQRKIPMKKDPTTGKARRRRPEPTK